MVSGGLWMNAILPHGVFKLHPFYYSSRMCGVGVEMEMGSVVVVYVYSYKL